MKTQRIFIIDPEAYNATIQIKALERAGWEVKKTYTTTGVESCYQRDVYDKLNYFDVIILSALITPDKMNLSPLNVIEKNFDPREVCWLVYEKYLKSLKNTKIIIWCPCRQESLVQEHPEWEWDGNVVFLQRNIHDEQNLLNVVT